MRYSEARPLIQLGDVLLFEGNGETSEAIKRGQTLAGHPVCCSKYSHVAMVVIDPDDKRVRCWESTTLSNIPDATTGEYTNGVQEVFLSDRLAAYDGMIWCRRVATARSDATVNAYRSLRSKLHGRPYEKDRLELARAALSGWAGNRHENLVTVFCSELLAETHQAFGWFSPDVPSNSMSPAHWAAVQPQGCKYVMSNPTLLEL